MGVNRELPPSWALHPRKIAIDGANSLPTPLFHTHRKKKSPKGPSVYLVRLHNTVLTHPLSEDHRQSCGGVLGGRVAGDDGVMKKTAQF